MGISLLSLKVDMAKAYDRVFRKNYASYGHAHWILLIIACISTVQFHVLFEGAELGHIIPHRGLRQGDPPSPYLYIICAEALSMVIQTKEREGTVHGCKIAPA